MNNILEEIELRRTVLYLFKYNKLLETYNEQNMDIYRLSKVLSNCIAFCQTTYFPQENRNELIRQLSIIRDSDDSNDKNKKKILINDAIMEINVTVNVRSCKWYVEELRTRRPNIKVGVIYIEDLLEQYLDDVYMDVHVLETHLDSEKKVNPEEFPDMKKYYETIRYLIYECRDLLKNKVFISSVNEVINHTNGIFKKMRLKKLINKKG